MDDLIRMTAARLGLEEETAQQVVGTLLSLVRDAADEEDAKILMERLPQAQELLDSAVEEGEGGGLMGMLGGMLGGSVGAAMSTFSRLREQGLDTDQIGAAGRTMFDYLSENLDSDLVQRLVARMAENVPGIGDYLSDFLGGEED